MSEYEGADRERASGNDGQQAHDSHDQHQQHLPDCTAVLHSKHQRGLATASAVGCWMEKAQYRRIVGRDQGSQGTSRSLASIPPRYNNIPCGGERLLPRFTWVRDIMPPAISISIDMLVSFGIRNPHCHAFSPPPPCSDHDHEPDSQARRPLEARRAQRGQRLATRG